MVDVNKNLKGESFCLTIPSEKGKVLTVNVYGKLNYDSPAKDTDCTWSFVRTQNYYMTDDEDQELQGYYLVSKKYNMALDYDPTAGELIRAVPYIEGEGGNHTIWHVSSNSEIFTIDLAGDGEHKKYLWSILDGVYVTHDEHLAEPWTAITSSGLISKLSEQKLSHTTWIIIILSIMLAIGVWRLYRHRKV